MKSLRPKISGFEWVFTFLKILTPGRIMQDQRVLPRFIAPRWSWVSRVSLKLKKKKKSFAYHQNETCSLSSWQILKAQRNIISYSEKKCSSHWEEKEIILKSVGYYKLSQSYKNLYIRFSKPSHFHWFIWSSWTPSVVFFSLVLYRWTTIPTPHTWEALYWMFLILHFMATLKKVHITISMIHPRAHMLKQETVIVWVRTQAS